MQKACVWETKSGVWVQISNNAHEALRAFEAGRGGRVSQVFTAPLTQPLERWLLRETKQRASAGGYIDAAFDEFVESLTQHIVE